MSQCIICPYADTIAVIYPAAGAVVEQVAKLSVPQGVPYLIIDAEEIPKDGEYRDAWTADFSEPDGHGEAQVETGGPMPVDGDGQ